jgi:hypothetical protein
LGQGRTAVHLVSIYGQNLHQFAAAQDARRSGRPTGFARHGTALALIDNQQRPQSPLLIMNNRYECAAYFLPSA